MELQPGQMLLHYRLAEKLGAGGMGVVYVAEDTKLQRRVALKVLPAEVADNPDRRSRFEREARAVAALNHPNIVTLHSIEEAEGIHFLTMELVPGRSLDGAIADGGMDLERFFDLAVPLADALARAHGQGIVHRDIKAANIIQTDEGVPKILDFGLAKMADEQDESPADSLTPTLTEFSTRTGAVLGTPAYMAPEQALGRPVDARSDVFSLGTVFYEMLSGERPFQRNTDAASLQALLHDSPGSLSAERSHVPRDVRSILDRCLAKDPRERFPSAAELHAALVRSRERHVAPPASLLAALTRPRAARPLNVGHAAAAAAIGWWLVRDSRLREVRTRTVPRIESLLEDGNHYEAFMLAQDARRRLPDDPTVEKLFQASSIPITVTTEPPGATIRIREYRDNEGEWFLLGESPLVEVRAPGGYMQFRIERAGYEPLLAAYTSWWGTLHFELAAEGQAPVGMVLVPAGRFAPGGAPALELPAFWIDRFEVTNRRFQEFVDAGGYRDESYWQLPFEDGDRELTFEQAMARFVDATGRPGPATWSVGRYPEGEDDHPVRGVSWYEAAAFAAWAGNSLPSFYHWRRAAGLGIFADILVMSNFGGDGPAAAGAYRGLSPYGSYDMAGNVNEWCFNRVGSRRYALGGAWNEPAYTFMDDVARPPFDRSPNLGFRCVRYESPPPEAASAPIEMTRVDFGKIEILSDEMFELIVERYDYVPGELDPRVEVSDDSGRHWQRESVSFEPAYEGTRMLAHLFLPTGVDPPYQVVLYRPGSTVNWVRRIEDFAPAIPVWIPRSGRALVVPAIWGTLERPSEQRSVIRQAQDIRRTIDYLALRPDFDLEKLAYVGLSAGAEYGPVYVAVEPRFKVAVFLAGGFHDQHMMTEPRHMNPWHFTPRIHVPTLMVNGANDFTLPLELAQKPMFELLATPPEHKRHVVLEGGHVPFDENAVIRETLDWLDLYLGPVATR